MSNEIKLTPEDPVYCAPLNVEAIGRGFSSSLQISAYGYWSRDPITVYIRRGYRKDKETGSYLWEFSISHSSGGRDTKQVECDEQAVRYFAQGLLLAAQLVDTLKGQLDELNRFADDEMEKHKRAAEEAARAQQAKFDADTPLGDRLAKALVLTAEAAVLTTGKACRILAANRGSDAVYDIPVLRDSRTGRITFDFRTTGMRKVSGRKAVEHLACLSHRTALAKPPQPETSKENAR
jgi:hypothetical protein